MPLGSITLNEYPRVEVMEVALVLYALKFIAGTCARAAEAEVAMERRTNPFIFIVETTSRAEPCGSALEPQHKHLL